MALKWNRTVRVLVTDDSLVMRGVFREMFSPGGALLRRGAAQVELCGLAQDGVDCLEAVGRLRPDVLLLDLEMPRMNGLEVLARLRVEAPTLPAIMCSAYTERGARSTLDGLARGAADYVTKPTMQGNAEAAMEALAEELLPKIAALAGWSFVGAASGTPRLVPAMVGGATPMRMASPAPVMIRARPPMRHSMPMVPLLPRLEDMGESTSDVEAIAIGVSTGGPSALERMLPRLPKNFPAPILIVQHMPKLFTSALAERLDRCCALHVEEAYDGAPVKPGTIWLAPGDAHMEVAPAQDGHGTVVRLRQGEPLNHYKPAVDYLFASVAKRYGAGALVLVMTGMGSDGLVGSRAVREVGGSVLVQDEATSAVWGMPGRVAEAGLATAMLSLDAIAPDLLRRATRRSGGNGAGMQEAAKMNAWEGQNGLL